MSRTFPTKVVIFLSTFTVITTSTVHFYQHLSIPMQLTSTPFNSPITIAPISTPPSSYYSTTKGTTIDTIATYHHHHLFKHSIDLLPLVLTPPPFFITGMTSFIGRKRWWWGLAVFAKDKNLMSIIEQSINHKKLYCNL